MAMFLKLVSAAILRPILAGAQDGVPFIQPRGHPVVAIGVDVVAVGADGVLRAKADVAADEEDVLSVAAVVRAVGARRLRSTIRGDERPVRQDRLELAVAAS